MSRWAAAGVEGEQRIDPIEALGIIPSGPLAYWGWGAIPTSTGSR